jgi:hypothetical protein
MRNIQGVPDVKTFTKWHYTTAIAVLATMAMAPSALHAAQLSGDARASIPRDVQQIIVVDYRQMQNSPAAMQLKDRVLPPELKHLETALKTSGLQVDQDADTLAFAAFRTSGAGASGGEGTGTRILGVAQGQFNTQAIMAKFAKDKTKPTMLRNNAIYPMGSGGMSVAFLNQTTMVFGDKEAVRAALDARDGLQPNFLQNSEMMGEMPAVDSQAVWSILDQKGTQTMMKSVLGAAAGLADYDTVKNRMKDASYTMDFANGVRFNMSVDMSDTITAATAATLMKGVALMKKSSGRRFVGVLLLVGQPVCRTSVFSVIPAGSGQVAFSSSDKRRKGGQMATLSAVRLVYRAAGLAEDLSSISGSLPEARQRSMTAARSRFDSSSGNS